MNAASPAGSPRRPLLALPDALERRLEPRRRVVAEVADGAAGEARQAGHERRLELRHQRAAARRRTAPAAPSISPACSMTAWPSRARSTRNGSLPRKRVAADVLAAFDALQQERVVGVLGDLQERRHRRQQVGHDLLVHRHERAALRQLDELFERRLFHTGVPASALRRAAIAANRRSAASWRTRASGVTPVHHSNCRTACATSMSRPSRVRQPAAAASRSNRVGRGL